MEAEKDITLTFPSIVDLYNTEELLPSLLEEETLPTHIDLSNVEKMTTAGVQLLLSITLTANKIDTPVTITPTDNDAATQAASALGLTLSECLNQETP